MKRRFKQVDVFTARPFFGNPVAVVLDAEGLSTEHMQRIARWTNLSETTFVLAPSDRAADYRLRIFTPAAELPFAGHPTIGSAHAVREAGIVARTKQRLVQECGAGLLDLAVENDAIFVTAPQVVFKPFPASESDALARALGITGAHTRGTPEVAHVGPVWLVAQLADAASVEALKPDMGAIAALSERLGLTGITVFGATAGGADAVAVRSFAPLHGVPEDPVCGSGNISVAAFLSRTQVLPSILPRYSASQGRPIGRDGHVAVRIDPERDTVQVGGHSVTCVDGVLDT